MHLHRNLPIPTDPSQRRGGVVTLGNFDGVHLGHQALIAALQSMAKANNYLTHVVTFSPHPRDYFAAQGRGTPVANIANLRDRIERLAKLGIDHLHVLRFNHALATLSPQDFVKQILLKSCNAKVLVVGRDVRFGHQRAGDLTLLQTLGQQHGFAVHLIEDVLTTQAQARPPRISSSAVRSALQAGDISSANTLLGYDYAIAGRVIHGRKIGRTLACPTLNLIPRMSNPALRGIAVVAIDGLAAQRQYGVASLGLRPTVEQTTRFSLEVHVFDWSGNAYGQRVRITFLHKLRDEAAYVDLATLQMAIAQDMLDARAWLKQYPQPLGTL
jgi:riboflavin kinase / FMN adenylyltransferase